MNDDVRSVCLAAAVLGLGGVTFREVHRLCPPPGGGFVGKGRYRDRTADDERAFRNRVARRRARKGYA